MRVVSAQHAAEVMPEVLKQGAQEDKGDTARLVSASACMRRAPNAAVLLRRGSAACASSVCGVVQQYFVGAIAVGDLVKSTLGPKGLDKILSPMDAAAGGGAGGPSSVRYSLTNDGATILKSVWIDNPAARILADLALQQDSVCGDGTTGVVVMASELLRQAESLVEKNIHPQARRIPSAARSRASAKKDAQVAVAVSSAFDADHHRRVQEGS